MSHQRLTGDSLAFGDFNGSDSEMGKPNKVRFTERKVQDIEANGKQTWIGDEGSPLRLMVSPAGAKSWYVERRVNGKPSRLKVGSWPDVPVEAARRLAFEQVGRMAAGVDIVAERNDKRRRATVHAYTVGDALADYIRDAESGHARSRPLKPTTLAEYRRLSESVLKPLHKLPLQEVDGNRIDELRRKHTASIANAGLRLLRASSNSACDRDLIEQNPFARRRRIITSLKPRDDLIRESELGRFLLACDHLQAEPGRLGEQVAADAILLMVLYGLRKSEALSLSVAAVDLTKAAFHIESNKSDRPLTLPITSHAREVFERRLVLARQLGSGYVFPTIGNNPSKRGWLAEPRRAVQLLTERTGIEFTPHALRRTFSSFVALRIPTAVMKAILNHAATDHGDVTFTHYVRVSCEDMREPLRTVHTAMLVLKQGPLEVSSPENCTRLAS